MAEFAVGAPRTAAPVQTTHRTAQRTTHMISTEEMLQILRRLQIGVVWTAEEIRHRQQVLGAISRHLQEADEMEFRLKGLDK